MPHGPFGGIAAIAFGIAASVLLVGGWILLRYHRDRLQFQLMQAALERGLTSMPGMIPGWVISLRQGILTLVLGLGLLFTGWALHLAANRIAPAPADQVTDSTMTMPADTRDRLRTPPPPPLPDQAARRDHDQDRHPEPPLPPRQSPDMERWHRVQSQHLTGLLVFCAGGILSLLGVVRIIFASVEKKYATEPSVGKITPQKQ